MIGCVYQKKELAKTKTSAELPDGEMPFKLIRIHWLSVQNIAISDLLARVKFGAFD